MILAMVEACGYFRKSQSYHELVLKGLPFKGKALDPVFDDENDSNHPQPPSNLILAPKSCSNNEYIIYYNIFCNKIETYMYSIHYIN